MSAGTGCTPGSQGAPGKRKGNLGVAEAEHLPWVMAFSPQEPAGGTNTIGMHHTGLFSAMESSCGSAMGSQDYTIPSYYSTWVCFLSNDHSVLLNLVPESGYTSKTKMLPTILASAPLLKLPQVPTALRSGQKFIKKSLFIKWSKYYRQYKQ